MSCMRRPEGRLFRSVPPLMSERWSSRSSSGYNTAPGHVPTNSAGSTVRMWTLKTASSISTDPKGTLSAQSRCIRPWLSSLGGTTSSSGKCCRTPRPSSRTSPADIQAPTGYDLTSASYGTNTIPNRRTVKEAWSRMPSGITMPSKT